MKILLPVLVKKVSEAQLWAKDTPLGEEGDVELRQLSSSGIDSTADSDL